MSQTVADHLLERLTEWGVERIYGYPGDGINAFLGALDRAEKDGGAFGLKPRTCPLLCAIGAAQQEASSGRRQCQ